MQSQAVEILMMVEDLDRAMNRQVDIMLGLGMGSMPSAPRSEPEVLDPEAGLEAELAGEATHWEYEGETPDPQEVEQLIRSMTSGRMSLGDSSPGGWE